jgi:hypothetical protein
MAKLTRSIPIDATFDRVFDCALDVTKLWKAKDVAQAASPRVIGWRPNRARREGGPPRGAALTCALAHCCVGGGPK